MAELASPTEGVAGHELLRQGRTELELIRMTPDVLYAQMIGVGAARRLVFSYGGNPGVGSLGRPTCPSPSCAGIWAPTSSNLPGLPIEPMTSSRP